MRMMPNVMPRSLSWLLGLPATLLLLGVLVVAQLAAEADRKPSCSRGASRGSCGSRTRLGDRCGRRGAHMSAQYSPSQHRTARVRRAMELTRAGSAHHRRGRRDVAGSGRPATEARAPSRLKRASARGRGGVVPIAETHPSPISSRRVGGAPGLRKFPEERNWITPASRPRVSVGERWQSFSAGSDVNVDEVRILRCDLRHALDQSVAGLSWGRIVVSSDLHGGQRQGAGERQRCGNVVAEDAHQHVAEGARHSPTAPTIGNIDCLARSWLGQLCHSVRLHWRQSVLTIAAMRAARSRASSSRPCWVSSRKASSTARRSFRAFSK
jgi:hypothetical protein